MAQQNIPRSTRSLWGAGLAALFLAIGGLGIWYVTAKNAPLAVDIQPAQQEDITRLLAVNGKIAAQNAVAIRAPVSATVLNIMVAEGDQVARGDVLAKLDAAQQNAAVIQAQSALQQGRLRANEAQDLFTRDAALADIISPAAMQTSKLALDGAVQDIVRLTALLDQATIQMSRYTLTAPIDGTVMTRSADLGQLVDPSAVLFTLADMSNLVVEATVDEAYATQIATGQKAVLQLVGTRDALAGQVYFVAPRVDVATGGLAIKIEFASAQRAAVGLTVTANIIIDERRAFAVPRAALHKEGVFVQTDGAAQLTAISYIDWPAERLIVTAGLKAGDMVLQDAAGITEGLRVVNIAP